VSCALPPPLRGCSAAGRTGWCLASVVRRGAGCSGGLGGRTARLPCGPCSSPADGETLGKRRALLRAPGRGSRLASQLGCCLVTGTAATGAIAGLSPYIMLAAGTLRCGCCCATALCLADDGPTTSAAAVEDSAPLNSCARARAAARRRGLVRVEGRSSLSSPTS